MGIIRILLALAVVLAHAPLAGQVGQSLMLRADDAVQAFFIISGFYMGLVLDTKYHQAGPFLINRLLRLFPVYAAMLAAALLLRLGAAPDFWAQLTELGVGPALALVLSNLTMLGQDLWLFAGSSGGQFYFTPYFPYTEPRLYSFMLLPQAWSLSLEIYFYLLAPWLVRWPTRWLLLLLGLSLGLRLFYYEWSGHAGDPWRYRFFPFELLWFVLGLLAYRWYRSQPEWRGGTTATVAIVGLILGFALLPEWYFFQVPVLSWAFLCTLAAALPAIFHQSRHKRWDRWVGDLSYPLYLCHLVVLAALNLTIVPTWGGVAHSAVMVVLSLVLAAMLVMAIDHPVDRWRARYWRACVKR